jgi:hypothetical protein
MPHSINMSGRTGSIHGNARSPSTRNISQLIGSSGKERKIKRMESPYLNASSQHSSNKKESPRGVPSGLGGSFSAFNFPKFQPKTQSAMNQPL